jgi:Ca2+-binding RTX toxin-like protein
LSLTADGRILVSYQNTSQEISEVIIDPRDNVIHGTAAGEVLTTQIGSTSIFGEGGDDTLLGQAGNDRFDGGPGADWLRGSAGNDTYVLQDIHRPDPNRPLFFVYDDVVEAPGGGSDTVAVQRVGVRPIADNN